MDKVNCHITSCIDKGAEIGEHTFVWHFSHIMGGAKIGRDCMIGQGCFIADVVIGDRVRIQNNVSVYNGVTLEDDVFIGPSAVLTNDHNPPNNDFRKTLIKKGARLGANVTIVCGVTIGEGAFVGAGAVVTHDIPAGETWYGNPATKRG